MYDHICIHGILDGCEQICSKCKHQCRCHDAGTLGDEGTCRPHSEMYDDVMCDCQVVPTMKSEESLNPYLMACPHGVYDGCSQSCSSCGHQCRCHDGAQYKGCPPVRTKRYEGSCMCEQEHAYTPDDDIVGAKPQTEFSSLSLKEIFLGLIVICLWVTVYYIDGIIKTLHSWYKRFTSPRFYK